VGGEGLDDDFAFEFAASRSAGDLSDELEGALACAEVWDVESEVSIEDSYEGDVGEVESFGDHLCADNDVDFVGFEFCECVAQGVFAAHGVGIDTNDAGLRENFLDDGFYFFCAEALEADGFVTAFWAFSGGDGLLAAHVADEAFFSFVVSERDGAVLAFADVSAGWALEGAGEASAVEKKYDLLAVFELGFHGAAELV